MKYWLWVYVSFWGWEWVIFGRMREGSEEVAELAEVVCSVRMVLLWAMQAYRSGVWVDDDAMVVERGVWWFGLSASWCWL